MVCLSRRYDLKRFKGCHPQILRGPFLNTLSKLYFQLQKKFSSTVFNVYKEINQQLDLVKQELDYMRLQYFEFWDWTLAISRSSIVSYMTISSYQASNGYTA